MKENFSRATNPEKTDQAMGEGSESKIILNVSRHREE